jgi:hypothetical protein
VVGGLEKRSLGLGTAVASQDPARVGTSSREKGGGEEEKRRRARKTEKCGEEETTARMCLSFQASLVLLVGFGGERWGGKWAVGSGQWAPRTAGNRPVGRRRD